MDLHDYSDVAQNYDLYLQAMYKDHDNYEGLNEFYLELAKQYGSNGVIDIACGSGEVALYLAKNNIRVQACDLSQAMCDVSNKKAKESGLNIKIFQGNMKDFKSDDRYSLAIIARSGFMHLLSPEDQRQALLNIKDHLVEGGILSFNSFEPNPFMQVNQINSNEDDYEYRLQYINSQGLKEKLYCSMHYDIQSQIMSGNYKFVSYDNDNNVIQERIRPVKMRQSYGQELKYLIELCGFKILKIYSDYHFNEEYSGSYVWVIQKV